MRPPGTSAKRIEAAGASARGPRASASPAGRTFAGGGRRRRRRTALPAWCPTTSQRCRLTPLTVKTSVPGSVTPQGLPIIVMPEAAAVPSIIQLSVHDRRLSGSVPPALLSQQLCLPRLSCMGYDRPLLYVHPRGRTRASCVHCRMHVRMPQASKGQRCTKAALLDAAGDGIPRCLYHAVPGMVTAGVVCLASEPAGERPVGSWNVLRSACRSMRSGSSSSRG